VSRRRHRSPRSENSIGPEESFADDERVLLGKPSVLKSLQGAICRFFVCHEALKRGDSPFSVPERELMAAYVSGVNACQYCRAPTAAARQFGVSDQLIGVLTLAAFRTKFIPLGAARRSISLNVIENEIRQKQFQNARVHFAIVCASKSCPALRPEAYRSSVLDQQLDEAARAVLDDPSKNRWAPAFRTLYLSERLEIAGAVPQDPIARHGTPTVAHEVGR
jgi:AhpD family alkylhydroperoxidase